MIGNLFDIKATLIKSFFEAARDGDIDALNAIIALDDFDIEDVFDQGALGEDELITAAQNGHHLVVERLLTFPVVAQYYDSIYGGYCDALEAGHAKVVEFLSRLPCVGLFIAAGNGHLQEFNQKLADLKQQGIDVGQMLEKAFKVAAMNGHLNVVERCLGFPDVIDALAYDDEFEGLKSAVKNGRFELARRLLEIPITNNTASDALRQAVANNDLKMLDLLLEFQVIRNEVFSTVSNDDNDCITNDYGPCYSAFTWAAYHGQLDVIDHFLELPEVANSTEVLGALIEAALVGQLEVVTRLLALHLVQQCILRLDEKVITAFVFAAAYGYIDVINCFLEFDVIRDNMLIEDNLENGTNTLTAAASNGHLNVVNRFLELLNDAYNPAHIIEALRAAAKYNRYEVVERLLELDRSSFDDIINEEFPDVFAEIENRRDAKVTAVRELMQWMPCETNDSTVKNLPNNIRSRILTFAFHDELCGRKSCSELIAYSKLNPADNICDKIEQLRMNFEHSEQPGSEPVQKKARIDEDEDEQMDTDEQDKVNPFEPQKKKRK